MKFLLSAPFLDLSAVLQQHTPDNLYQIVGQPTPENLDLIGSDVKVFPPYWYRSEFVPLQKARSNISATAWSSQHVIHPEKWMVPIPESAITPCASPKRFWCFHALGCFPSPDPRLRNLRVLLAVDAVVPGWLQTWGNITTQTISHQVIQEVPFLSVDFSNHQAKYAKKQLTISYWRSLVTGRAEEEETDETTEPLIIQTPPPKRKLSGMPIGKTLEQASTGWSLSSSHLLYPEIELPWVPLEVKILQGSTIMTPYGVFPVDHSVLGCSQSRQHFYSQLSLLSASTVSFEVLQDKNLLTVVPEFSGSWNLTIDEFSAYGPGKITSTIEIPKPVWETGSRAVFLLSPSGLAPQQLDYTLTPPRGCDLYGCYNCKGKAPLSCGPRINQFLYGIGIAFIVLMACSTICIILPWCYASWKVGSGIFWLMWKAAVFVTYGVRVTAEMIFYVLKRCFVSDEHKAAKARQENDDRRSQLRAAREKRLAEIKRSQAAHRALLPIALLLPGACASPVALYKSNQCSAVSSFMIPSNVCSTDLNGVTTCSLGAAGEINLVGVGDTACLQGLSETGRILSELRVRYDDFKCILSTDYLYTTADYLLDASGFVRCHGVPGCNDPKCALGAGPGGLHSGWEDVGYRTHTDMKVACKQFAGWGSNGCGRPKNMCFWHTIVPRVSGAPVSVSKATAFTCEAKITAQAMNMSPQNQQNAQLTVGSPTLMGDWTLTYLGTYEMGQVWAGPTVTLEFQNGTLLMVSDHYLGQSRGQLGDLRCPLPIDATDEWLQECRADVTYTEASFDRDTGLNINYGASGLSNALSVAQALPLRYASSQLSQDKGTLSVTLLQMPAATIAVSSTRNVTITVSTDDVCPQGELMELYGQTGAAGATIILSAYGKCQSGFVSVLPDNPAMKVRPSSLFLSTEPQTIALSLTTEETQVHFNLILQSISTQANITVAGTLFEDSPDIPSPPPIIQPGSGAPKPQAIRWPTWAILTTTFGGLFIFILLLGCCCGWDIFARMLDSCRGCCRKSEIKGPQSQNDLTPVSRFKVIWALDEFEPLSA